MVKCEKCGEEMSKENWVWIGPSERGVRRHNVCGGCEYNMYSGLKVGEGLRIWGGERVGMVEIIKGIMGREF